MYLQVQPTVWVTRDTLGGSAMSVATTPPAAQTERRNTNVGPATSSCANIVTAASRAAVRDASVHQRHMATLTSTQSEHANYTMSSAMRVADNGATALASPEQSLLQKHQQAALRKNPVDGLTVVRPQDPSPEIDSGVETNVVYQLRGVPFAATKSDVVNFLRTVKYCQLDVGVLATGESSGNAFVELHDRHAAQELMRLHKTIITVETDAAIPAPHRPRPRYVEVLCADSAKRDYVLCVDALTTRSALQHQRRVRASAVPLATARNSTPDSVTHTAISQTLRSPTQPPQSLLLEQHSTGSVYGGSHSPVAASVAQHPQRHEIIISILPNEAMEVRRFVDASFLPTNAYEQHQFHRQHNPSVALSNIMDSRAVPAPPPSALMACEPSRAPSASYQSTRLINPQEQSFPQRNTLYSPRFSLFVVSAGSSPLARVTETLSTSAAPLLQTHAPSSGGRYYLPTDGTFGSPPPLSPF